MNSRCYMTFSITTKRATILVVFQVTGTLAALPGSSMSPAPLEPALCAVEKRF